MKAVVQNGATTDEVEEFIRNNIESQSVVMTDSVPVYRRIKNSYDHYSVNHSKKEFARGTFRINTIETWFAHLKRSLTGIHKAISKKHLQSYPDTFVFHYNNRHNDKQRFSSLLGAVL